LDPPHDHDHGPEPVIVVGVPVIQRPPVGIDERVSQLDPPQTPEIGVGVGVTGVSVTGVGLTGVGVGVTGVGVTGVGVGVTGVVLLPTS
jgi:hypothetical protein